MLAFSRGVGWRRAPEPLVKTTKANSWPKGPTKELFDELGRIGNKKGTFLQIQSIVAHYVLRTSARTS